MRDNLCSCYFCSQESSGCRHPESMLVNSPNFIDIPSTSTFANAPVDVDKWSSAVAPIIGNDSRSQSTLPGVAEHFYRVAHEPHHHIALGGAPPLPPASSDYSVDALSTPSYSAVEAETVRAYASETAWHEGGVTVTQLGGGQVPPGTTGQGASKKPWSRHDNAYQAVPLFSQASLHNAGYPAHSVPAGIYMAAFPEVSACASSQSHMAGFGSVSPQITGAASGYAASPPRRRKHHARQDPVVCDKCKKLMRRQSLKRHIREVHNHVKRPHARPNFTTGP